jgi:hypothetical protein
VKIRRVVAYTIEIGASNTTAHIRTAGRMKIFTMGITHIEEVLLTDTTIEEAITTEDMTALAMTIEATLETDMGLPRIDMETPTQENAPHQEDMTDMVGTTDRL